MNTIVQGIKKKDTVVDEVYNFSLYPAYTKHNSWMLCTSSIQCFQNPELESYQLVCIWVTSGNVSRGGWVQGVLDSVGDPSPEIFWATSA
eukprot:1159695-Pelagomonas_calceolata.AAC.12